MRSGIRAHLAHHGRTTRRLNTSAFCHAIRSGRLRATRDSRFLRRDAHPKTRCGIPAVPVRDQGVAGSNPVSPIFNEFRYFTHFRLTPETACVRVAAT